MLGISANVQGPPNPFFLNLDPPKYLKYFNKRHKPFWEILWNLEISIIKQIEKTCAEKSLRSVLSNLENLEYGIDIVQKAWNGHLVFLRFDNRNPPTHPPQPLPNPTAYTLKPPNASLPHSLLAYTWPCPLLVIFSANAKKRERTTPSTKLLWVNLGFFSWHILWLEIRQLSALYAATDFPWFP